MTFPSLSEALSSWLTHMAQRGKTPLEIDERMIMMWRVLDYLEMASQFSADYNATVNVFDVIHAHYGHYESFIDEQRLNAIEVKTLYDTVNSFLAFVANEYSINTTQLRIIRTHIGKNRKATTKEHLSLINVLRNMERKQRRGVVGALLERHRELKEVDDLMRRIG